MATAAIVPSLQRLDPNIPHTFVRPLKRIHDHQDVETFLSSVAYRDIMIFVLQLNRCMFPSKVPSENGSSNVEAWTLDSDSVDFSEPVRRLQLLLSKLESLIDEVAPDTGPRRFGNISFRRWCEEMESRASSIMDECLPQEILQQKSEEGETVTAKEELMAYLTGSFGSSQRLDYGTGHELSFLAFLACLWKLNGFARADPGMEERGIVIGVIEPYLRLIRRLILTYTLEPAGSHGVWGLDDHSFISYILGSAQLSPAIGLTDPTPTEGSLSDAPATGDVAKSNIVEKERKSNMYFSAIGFIHDVKRGPFWEHSPMLYDISGIKDGWGKINKGMLKMYNAEVLSKFPVVQHFPFGSLFVWEQDPNAVPAAPSAHTSSGPQAQTQFSASSNVSTQPNTGTRAPWASKPTMGDVRGGTFPHPPSAVPPSHQLPVTRAPWANQSSQQRNSPHREPFPPANVSER
ncbi:serine/threonine-protein phosphatase 2A activator 1 [Nannizzia gypsea CBS 118893]|uniref:Serine/threonine-protein phosphatase 2A activator n=1 Tax=Arthroderma gypseum (strain ATCC MYA-4604 / CBS 118893) TaxID=535722 RepID=E5R0U6_ARTGP|nr:serine/threonine-protein phosphatase 2A activator 1 [Nannizzia gypsea CBS 118893]EFQ98388.1 serine/threonine-protein phosphatase 2A activator 1 [Nannizzia gypsea CBS 118893]